MPMRRTQCPKCQAKFNPDENPLFCSRCRFPLMTLAGKYHLESVLEKGGFSTLYLARHIHLSRGELRVVKVLNPDVLDKDEEFVRFQREVELTIWLAQANEHIVQFFDDFGYEEALGYFFVMEYLEGSTLQELLYEEYPIDPRLAFHIFEQLSLALHSAHKKGIVHRDLKPSNIFLVAKDTDPVFVKLLDFGIARLIIDQNHQNVTKQAIGTPDYMSPEQCLNQKVDARSDVYALGTLLYRLLTGITPFYEVKKKAGGSALPVLKAQISLAPNPIRQVRPDLNFPPELDRALLKSIEKDPEKRYPSALEFWQAIAPFAPSASSELLAELFRKSLEHPLPPPTSGVYPSSHSIAPKNPSNSFTLQLDESDLIEISQDEDSPILELSSSSQKEEKISPFEESFSSINGGNKEEKNFSSSQEVVLSSAEILDIDDVLEEEGELSSEMLELTADDEMADGKGKIEFGELTVGDEAKSRDEEEDSQKTTSSVELKSLPSSMPEKESQNLTLEHRPLTKEDLASAQVVLNQASLFEDPVSFDHTPTPKKTMEFASSDFENSSGGDAFKRPAPLLGGDPFQEKEGEATPRLEGDPFQEKEGEATPRLGGDPFQEKEGEAPSLEHLEVLEGSSQPSSAQDGSQLSHLEVEELLAEEELSHFFEKKNGFQEWWSSFGGQVQALWKKGQKGSKNRPKTSKERKKQRQTMMIYWGILGFAFLMVLLAFFVGF